MRFLTISTQLQNWGLIFVPPSRYIIDVVTTTALQATRRLLRVGPDMTELLAVVTLGGLCRPHASGVMITWLRHDNVNISFERDKE
jgi:hypothetical protein